MNRADGSMIMKIAQQWHCLAERLSGLRCSKEATSRFHFMPGGRSTYEHAQRVRTISLLPFALNETVTMSTANPNVDDDAIVLATRNWLERAVIGLNLCPFAKSVFVKEQVRYVVSNATTPEALLETLMDELQHLSDTPAEQVDTTLLIHPFVLTDFEDYNEFLDVADAAVEDMSLDGELQVASFHPDYQFADTDSNDISNYTNRAPYPILHLLREDSIARAVDAFPDAADIFEKNIDTMAKLGHEGWDKLDVGPAR